MTARYWKGLWWYATTAVMLWHFGAIACCKVAPSPKAFASVFMSSIVLGLLAAMAVSFLINERSAA